MGALLLKVRTWWETADRTQKAVTVFGSLFLVLLLGGTFFFASKPRMAMAFTGLDSQQVGIVSDEIQKLGIQCEYDLQGNVQVPSDKVAEVRAKLAVAGKLPAGNHFGEDALAKIGSINTPSVEREKLKSILEEKLATTIESISGIDKATVDVSAGEDSPFSDDKKPPKASVTVTQKPGESLSPEVGRGIAMLVANSVTGLTPDKVMVLDTSGRPLYDASEATEGFGLASSELKTQQEEKIRYEHDLQKALDDAFGPGNTIAKVNLELDFDKKTEDKTIHPASDAATVEETTKETMSNGGGSLIQPPAGTVANGPKPTTPVVADGSTDKGYTGVTKSVQRPDNVDITHTEPAVGTVKSLSISTMVNSTKIKDPKPVQDFIANYLGAKATDPAYKQGVTSYPFDTTVQEAVAKSEKASATRSTMQQAFSFLPIAALLFVGFLVVKAISKAAKTQQAMVAALPDGGMMALEGGAHVEDGQEHYEPGQEPEVEHSGHTPHDDIGSIAEKLNLPLEQIKRMSEDKAESVAMLIKTWLLEDPH
jgi:flagellar M-ring protein FliF